VVVLSLGVAGDVGWIILNQLIAVVNELPNYQQNIHEKIISLRSSGEGSLGQAAEIVERLGKELSTAPTPATAAAARIENDRTHAIARSQPAGKLYPRLLFDLRGYSPGYIKIAPMFAHLCLPLAYKDVRSSLSKPFRDTRRLTARALMGAPVFALAAGRHHHGSRKHLHCGYDFPCHSQDGYPRHYFYLRRPVTSAGLNTPDGVAFDSAGNMYIADAGNYRIS
jgi:hypothetical protein